jgi:F-type H+-transporting ATPase subunit delta
VVEFEYAKAVFDLAKENNKVSVFTECFNAVCETLEPNFLEIMSSPFVNKDEKKKIIDKVYHSLDLVFIHFLYVLIDHNRFDRIRLIAKEYETLVLQDNNVLRVKIISANEFKKSQLQDLKKSLSIKYPGKTIEIENKINPNLIGGVQIITDEKSLDASVKGTLDRIRESL